MKKMMNTTGKMGTTKAKMPSGKIPGKDSKGMNCNVLKGKAIIG